MTKLYFFFRNIKLIFNIEKSAENLFSVDCATLCFKNVVILCSMYVGRTIYKVSFRANQCTCSSPWCSSGPRPLHWWALYNVHRCARDFSAYRTEVRAWVSCRFNTFLCIVVICWSRHKLTASSRPGQLLEPRTRNILRTSVCKKSEFSSKLCSFLYSISVNVKTPLDPNGAF